MARGLEVWRSQSAQELKCVMDDGQFFKRVHHGDYLCKWSLSFLSALAVAVRLGNALSCPNECVTNDVLWVFNIRSFPKPLGSLFLCCSGILWTGRCSNSTARENLVKKLPREAPLKIICCRVYVQERTDWSNFNRVGGCNAPQCGSPVRCVTDQSSTNRRGPHALSHGPYSPWG